MPNQMCLYYLNRSNDNVSEKQHEKELDQKEYTDAHIANVKQAWQMMKSSRECMLYIEDAIRMKTLPNNLITINTFVHMEDLQISSHDWTKYSSEEWEPYRKHFFPVDDKEKEDSKEEFEKAWEHHYTVNHHHWEHWYKIKNDVDRMTLLAVVELCCDWIAMNMVFEGTALDFYDKCVVNCTDPDEQIYLGEKQSEFIHGLLTRWYKDYPKNK